MTSEAHSPPQQLRKQVHRPPSGPRPARISREGEKHGPGSSVWVAGVRGVCARAAPEQALALNQFPRGEPACCRRRAAWTATIPAGPPPPGRRCPVASHARDQAGSPAHNALEHGALPARLAANDNDLRQINRRPADAIEDILEPVDDGNQRVHRSSSWAQARARPAASAGEATAQLSLAIHPSSAAGSASVAGSASRSAARKHKQGWLRGGGGPLSAAFSGVRGAAAWLQRDKVSPPAGMWRVSGTAVMSTPLEPNVANGMQASAVRQDSCVPPGGEPPRPAPGFAPRTRARAAVKHRSRAEERFAHRALAARTRSDWATSGSPVGGGALFDLELDAGPTMQSQIRALLRTHLQDRRGIRYRRLPHAPRPRADRENVALGSRAPATPPGPRQPLATACLETGDGPVAQTELADAGSGPGRSDPRGACGCLDAGPHLDATSFGHAVRHGSACGSELSPASAAPSRASTSPPPPIAIEEPGRPPAACHERTLSAPIATADADGEHPRAAPERERVARGKGNASASLASVGGVVPLYFAAATLSGSPAASLAQSEGCVRRDWGTQAETSESPECIRLAPMKPGGAGEPVWKE